MRDAGNTYGHPPGDTGTASLGLETGSPTAHAPPRPSPDFTGRVIAGRYHVVRFIASGGMGEVFEVEDRELRVQVALKRIRFDSGRDPARDQARYEALRREVALARRVTHPNVCRLYDIGWDDGDQSAPSAPFFTMELLAGETLSQHIRRRGSLSPADAYPIVQQLAAGLAAAHAAGVVHRDFKSQNVMLVDAGSRVVITDFGLARITETGPYTAESGALMGTPATMAPEQVIGEPVTFAADIYALGVVMFEMVTGRLPFVGPTAVATATLRVTHDAPSARTFARDLDDRWEAAIARCLRRPVGERFARVEDVVAALTASQTVVMDRAHTARPPPRPLQLGWLVALGATLVVVAGLLTAGFLVFKDAGVPTGRVVDPNAKGVSGPGPSVGGAFSKLTPENVRARIERSGRKITTTSEGPTYTMYQFEVTPTSWGGVMFYQIPDEATAKKIEAGWTPKGYLVRDKTALLFVYGMSTEESKALAAIISK